MSQTLAERLAEPDMVNLADWQAADALNQPDNTLPVIVYWVVTAVGPGTIMETLGTDEGAALLDTIESSTDPVMKWGLRVIESGNLDISQPATRTQLDAMVTAGVITSDQRDDLFALSMRERYPSWAEYNDTYVDARAVGIARGGVA